MICNHTEVEAFESYPSSIKNWNGFCRCKNCRKIIFYPIVKYYLDLKNGIEFDTKNYLCYNDKIEKSI